MVSESHRVVLVDDHPVFRLGLRSLLEARHGYRVVAEAESVPSAMKVLRDVECDVAIVDLMLKGGSGTELVRWIRTEMPQVRVLVVSMLDEELYAERCVRGGASGFLQKSEAPRSLFNALERVLAGDVYLGEGATQRLMRRVAGGMAASENPLLQLTDRELEVFQLIGQGHRTAEIARMLHISPKTVESHQAKLRRKLGARDGVELLRLSVAWRQQGGRLPTLDTELE
ncbi:MAG: response regulator transcription factor [Deltaproteobacteria bacterium]|nr:MAG: response regulator transcription factor [Deltaproteobacteria bacterium]